MKDEMKAMMGISLAWGCIVVGIVFSPLGAIMGLFVG